MRIPIRMHISLLTLLIYGLISITPASAATELTLTLDQALSLALERNPGLQQTALSVETARADVSGAVGGMFPDLTLSASGGHQYDRAGADPDPQRNYESMSTTASAQMTLFHGLEKASTLRGARHTLDAQRLNLTWAQQTLAFNVVAQFFQVVIDQELVGVEQENLKQNQEQLRLIESYQQAGKRSLGDVYSQRVTASRAEQTLLEAQRNLEVDRLTLLQTLGMPAGSVLRLVPPSTDQAGAAPEQADLQSIVDKACDQRADVRAQQKLIDAQVQNLRQARAGYWPELGAYADLKSGYSNLEETGFDDQYFDEQVAAGVGLTLSIPLFDGLKTRTAVAQANASTGSARLDLVSLKQQVAVDVGQALAEYRTALQQVAVAEAQLQSAQQALDAADARYAVGAATLLELSSARAAYVQANYDMVNAQYGLIERRLALAFQQGELLQALSAIETAELK